MSVRLIVLLVLALGSAGFTAILAQNWLVSEKAQMRASMPSVQILQSDDPEIMVASKDLVPGSFVTKDKLSWQKWPESALGDHMLKKGDVNFADFTGAVIRTRIPAGQPLVPSALVKTDEQGFLAAVLAPGMRAVSVPVNATAGVGGFVFPGDKVDVLLSVMLKPEGETSALERDFHFTQTLFRNIRVIAMDQAAVQEEGPAKVAKTATLEVTPKQAEALALSIQIGRLSLSLRSLAEEEVILTELQEGEKATGPKHDVMLSKALMPLEPEEQSFTTDVEVNYFLQKMMKTRKTGTTSHSVKVHRGGDTAVREFK